MRSIAGSLRRWLVLLVAVLAATVGTSGPAVAQTRVAVDDGAYTDVGPAGLASMLRTKRFPLINVHIPYEGEIDGTDLFIAFDQIEANLDKLPADKAARIVLYCRSGSMSAVAARALVKRGYTDVWNLDGGMIAWTHAGHSIISRRR
jgi:phage shock protein E